MGTCNLTGGAGMTNLLVEGTLADSSDSPVPFARFDNLKTTRLIRMPSASQDVNGLLSRPVPTSAWWAYAMASLCSR